MYQNQITIPIIKQALQRFDIADHTLLTDAIYGVASDVVANTVLSGGVGRVFYGFKVTQASATQATVSGAALAVSGYGDVMIRATGDATVTMSGPTAGGGWAASKQYPVYAYTQELEVTPTVNRKKWDTGTDAEVTVSVSVQKQKVVQIYVGAALTIGTIVMASYFPTTITDLDGVVRRVVPLAVIQTNGSSQIASVTDCRQMFAVDGNVDGSVTGLGSELPHNFAPTDAKTLGINSVRDHLRALADRIKAITGESTWEANPDATIASLASDLATAQTQGMQVLADFAALSAVAPGSRNNNDLRLIRDKGIYIFVSASAETALEGQIIAPDTGTGRWHRYDDAIMQAQFGPRYGAELVSGGTTRTRVKEIFAPEMRWQTTSGTLKPVTVTSNTHDLYVDTVDIADGVAIVDIPPGAIVTHVGVVAKNRATTDEVVTLRVQKVRLLEDTDTPESTSLFTAATATLLFTYDVPELFYTYWATCNASEAIRTFSDLYAEDTDGTSPTRLRVQVKTPGVANFDIFSIKIKYTTARVRG